MRTHYSCPICVSPDGAGGGTQWGSRTSETAYAEVRLTAEPVALAECDQGHRLLVCVNDGSYALLFERALQRLAIGSTTDAVIDAHTAFEIYLAHVPARARYDRESGASPTVLRRELRPATSSAQLALGAALATVSVVSSRPPPRINEEMTTTLRNRAVHAGHHPTDSEAEHMCAEIDRVIAEFEDLLTSSVEPRDPSYWNAFISEDIKATIEAHGWRELPIVGRQLDTVLARARDGFATKVSARERLAEYRQNKTADTLSWSVW